ncbi:hypothetical protein [Noviherbaspirillum autotrophicum]|uniref:hypothetical protein n=1 Tax=Noviherbaspirillum autotrophicum TaxID=709839 RepID=UPI0012FD4D48|nr:hypothetical protein [Noviherbaspirillum autotrophicum]
MMVLLMAASCGLAVTKKDMNVHRRISSKRAASLRVSFSGSLVKMDGADPGERMHRRAWAGLLLACVEFPFD